MHITGNGTSTSTRHNALEIHLSGEVKIPDTHASGEVYQKPMFVLQDKLYQIDSSIAALEANSGGSGSADLSNYYTKSHIDSSISALDASVRTFAPVQYATLDEYNDLVDEQTVDENKLYIITDVADTDDLADFVSYSSLSSLVNAVSGIRDSVTTETLILEPNVG